MIPEFRPTDGGRFMSDSVAALLQSKLGGGSAPGGNAESAAEGGLQLKILSQGVGGCLRPFFMNGSGFCRSSFASHFIVLERNLRVNLAIVRSPAKQRGDITR